MEIASVVTHPFGLGEKLILELLKRDESVYTVFPSPKVVPMSFLGKNNLKYGFVQFDRDLDLERALPKKTTTVFHLYDVYSGSFTRMFRCNANATLSLLDWARKAGVARFIHLSSGEVYGQGQKINEKAHCNPRSFYATTKCTAEVLFRFYKSFDIHTVRLFYPFGKNYDQGYVAQLAQAIQHGDDVETDYSIISPTFFDDIVEPLLKLRSMKESNTVNMCGSPTPVSALVETLKTLYGTSPKKVSIGTTELSGDNSMAMKMLGYKETPIAEALKRSFGA